MERLIGRKLNFFIFLEIMIRSHWNTALYVFLRLMTMISFYCMKPYFFLYLEATVLMVFN